MSDQPFSMVLPIFEASEPASAALHDKEIANYGSIVSRSGDSYRLHRVDDLMHGASSERDPTQVLLAETNGQLVKELSARVVADIGLDLIHPRRESVYELCQRLQSDVVIGQLVQSASGHPMVTVFVNPNVDIRLTRRKYICSVGRESYDERDYRSNGGSCPIHLGGTLS